MAPSFQLLEEEPTEMEPLYRGSVKDILGPKTLGGEQAVVFRYTDAYSVFDWGKMPDALPGKGQALALMAAYFFEQLERPESWKEFSRSKTALDLRKGIGQFHGSSGEFNEVGELLQREGLRSHYLGLTSESDFQGKDLICRPLRDWSSPTPYMAVKSVQVVRPQGAQFLGKTYWDYRETRAAASPKLIPLEVVFRFGCPPGSSLLEAFPNDPQFKPGAKWSFPYVEFFTKLESTDRRLSFTEALGISGISARDLQFILIRTIWIAGWIKDAFSRIGVEVADGKLEWALDSKGQPFLVDGIGPDELRLLVGDVQLSKEFLRGFYRKTRWFDSVQDAKEKAKQKGTTDWKPFVHEPVPQLDAAHKEIGIQIYPAITNALLGQVYFKQALPLERLVEEMKKGVGA